MARQSKITVKKNVSKFGNDILESGSYLYTSEKLSCKLANGAISRAIQKSYDWKDKNILDIGCGDGAYTIEFLGLGVSKITGLDPSEEAIKSARTNHITLENASMLNFEVGNVYEMKSFLATKNIDCIVIRGVLHHLPDAKAALQELSFFNGVIIILEPNGSNPVLKIIEKTSVYHIEHEEQSFTGSRIDSWLNLAGFKSSKIQYLNLVPMFCPDWAARVLNSLSPFVEKLPFIRKIACGQVVLIAKK